MWVPLGINYEEMVMPSRIAHLGCAVPFLMHSYYLGTMNAHTIGTENVVLHMSRGL